MPRKSLTAAGRGPSSSGSADTSAAAAARADEDTTADTTNTRTSNDASGDKGAAGAGRSKSKSKSKSKTKSNSKAAPKPAPRRSPARRGGSSTQRGGRKSYSEQDDDAEFERMLAGGGGSSDGGDDGDEDDASNELQKGKKKAAKPKPKAKPRSRSVGKASKASKAKHNNDDDDDDDDGDAKASPYRCPKCHRSFKQRHGLDYHVKRNVCQDGKIKTPPNQSRGGRGGKFGPLDMRTCPYCQRVFSIVSGLAYHLQHKVCQRDAGGGGSGGRKSGGPKKKKGGVRAKVTREERSLAGTAPFPPLQPGQRFVTQYGVVEVVADDRIPDDYGTTKIAGYDATKVRGGVDEAKLVQLGRDCQRYKRSKEREKDREERIWAQRVRSNLRKRRRLGRHYAQEAGWEPAGGAASASVAPAGVGGGRPLATQMVVWQESVSTKTLTPDTILNYGATYKPPRDAGDVMGITFSAKGGIKEEEGAAHPAPAKVPQAKIDDPLVPANSYPDRIVTCRLVPDKRKRIYDHSARLASAAASATDDKNESGGDGSGSAKVGALKSMETAWDIVLRAKEDAKRSQQEEAGVDKSNGGGGSTGGDGGEEKKKNEECKDEERKEEEEGEGNGTDDPAASPIITKLCLRRCLLTEPYNPSRPVFICRDCGKALKTREGLREHVLTRVCQPPEPETDESSEEEEEAVTEAIEEPVAPKKTSGGITLRAQRKRKRKVYVEISSDDEEEGGGGGGGGGKRNKKKNGKRKKADDDDDEWDATAAANAQDDDEDDDDISMVSEKEDDGPVEVEVADDDTDVLLVDAVPLNSSKKGKKRSRSSLASLTSGKSRKGRSRRGGNNRSAALADFDPDDDSSVEMMSVVSRSHKTPVKDKFGVDPDRRLSRKEWKRLKRPGWMQFKPEASSWYPEIMKCLSIKRGSNNQNWKRLKTERKRFEPVKNVRRERKAKQRLGDGPIYPPVMAKLNMWEGIQNKTIYPNVFEYLGFDKSRNAPRTRSMRPRSTPALELFGDEDKNYERRDQQAKRIEGGRERAQDESNIEEQPKPSKRRRRATKKTAATASTVPAFSSSRGTTKLSSTGSNSGRGASSRKRKKKPNPPPTTLPDGGNDVTSTNFTINSFKMAGGPMIDLNVLVEEVDAGRFPSMKRYEEDDHIDVCEICHETSDDGDRGPVYCCAFCPNAEHFSCLKSRYNVHEWDEDDDFMCHSCLATCLHRRHRAERRRLGQIDDRKSKKKKTSTARDDYTAQDDDGLAPMEVDDDNNIHVGDVDEGHQQMPPLPSAASEAQRKTDIDLGNISHQMPAPACPSGGPGGLICCAHCATSYSQILANTTKEMEAQTVEKVGQEVGELMEMLRDAQTRLRLAVDVSKEKSFGAGRYEDFV